jgi:hypothetical protein
VASAARLRPRQKMGGFFACTHQVVIRLIFFFLTGCTQGYNQWVGGVREVKRGYHILCKSTAAMPYLNRPLKQACTAAFAAATPVLW